MSTIKVDTIKDTNNVEVYTAKAWVNFDGTWTSGDPIRASGNVSSITDNGNGDYTVTFTNAMTNVNYVTFSSCRESLSSSGSDVWGKLYETAQTTTTTRVATGQTTTNYNAEQVNVVVFR